MDVCAKLRGILKEKRIGHGGTLDPMATGVLPVFAGLATKAADLSVGSRKEYVAGLRLGIVTNTQDITGEVMENHPVAVNRQAVETVLSRFTGDIVQIPPMYSAIKVRGKKLCELARKGKEIERQPRPVTIDRLELLEQASDRDYVLRCQCSKGTYIRTLCHDIGQALGCGGTMYSLRRTMAAGFTLEQALSLEDIQRAGDSCLLPVDSLFADYPAFTLPTVLLERRVRNGNPITAENLTDGLYRVYDRTGVFLCLSRAERGTLRSVKNFFVT